MQPQPQSVAVQSLRSWRGALPLALALIFLNGLLSFTSWWPTIAVQPDSRIAPEFVGLVLVLCIWMARSGRVPGRGLTVLAAIYGLLILGRYVDVVAPTLFGRPISLYWDVPQLPRFIWVTATGSPPWAVVLVSVAIAVGTWSVIWGLRYVIRILGEALLPWSRSKRLWAVLTPFILLCAANYAGVVATWPYVSKPVMPTYWRELKLVWDSRSPERIAQLLPARTVVDTALEQPPGRALAALGRRDLMLMFLESFGAVLYDDPQVAARVGPSREQLAEAISASGRQVVSAYYRSPTIGGASDLAHLSLLSGIDLSDPRRHDLLITTERPTLLSVFRQAGYETFGVYPSVFWDWVERGYYGFDVYLDGPSLGYEGPPFGYWKIPDQYAMARLLQAYPAMPAARPRMTIFATMATHFPFVPTPPYQPDWARVLTKRPFDEAAVAQASAQKVNWQDMRPDYLSTVNYAHTWLTGFFSLPEARDTVYLLVGDHQPTTNVAGEGARWDVPVYLVARDSQLLERFRRLGFRDGMHPDAKPLGGLHDLTATLLSALSDSPVSKH